MADIPEMAEMGEKAKGGWKGEAGERWMQLKVLNTLTVVELINYGISNHLTELQVALADADMTTRVEGSIVSFVVGVVALWAAFTGKPIYSGRAHKEPMPPKEGRTIATIVGVFAILFAVWFFFA